MISKSLRSGFSMVELMIYIAVVGILVLVIAPNFMSYFKKAAISTTNTNIQVVKQALTSYYSDTGRYPESLRDLVRKPHDEIVAKRWQGPYLELKDEDDLPIDGWKNELVYRRIDGVPNKPYELYSYGPNGDAGTEEERIYG